MRRDAGPVDQARLELIPAAAASDTETSLHVIDSTTYHRVTQHKESWTEGEGKEATARRCLARDRLTSCVCTSSSRYVLVIIHIWIHGGSPKELKEGVRRPAEPPVARGRDRHGYEVGRPITERSDGALSYPRRVA